MHALRSVLCFAALAATVHASESSSDSAGTVTKAEQFQLTAETALERLREGNARFVSGVRLSRDWRAQVQAVSHGQFPFASIVSCIDSRGAVEHIFDLGLGDVFNARVAGNIINDDILGSLEYAHKVAGAKLIVVLGHASCGAVKGAADDVILGNLTGLLARIKPAVVAVPDDGKGRTSENHDFIDKVARMNVILTVRQIRDRSPVLREMHDRGQIDIIGGFYDLETGKVEFYRPLVGAETAAAPAAAPATPAAPAGHTLAAAAPAAVSNSQGGH